MLQKARNTAFRDVSITYRNRCDFQKVIFHGGFNDFVLFGDICSFLYFIEWALFLSFSYLLYSLSIIIINTACDSSLRRLPGPSLAMNERMNE